MGAPGPFSAAEEAWEECEFLPAFANAVASLVFGLVAVAVGRTIGAHP